MTLRLSAQPDRQPDLHQRRRAGRCGPDPVRWGRLAFTPANWNVLQTVTHLRGRGPRHPQRHPHVLHRRHRPDHRHDHGDRGRQRRGQGGQPVRRRRRVRQPGLAGPGQHRGGQPPGTAGRPDARRWAGSRPRSGWTASAPSRPGAGWPGTSTRRWPRTRPTARPSGRGALVLYDLPNRDCPAPAPAANCSVTGNGLARYRAEYIDPIRDGAGPAALRQPAGGAWSSSPGSLLTMITRGGARPFATLRCIEAQQSARLPRRHPVRGEPAQRRWPTPICTWTSPTRAGSAGRTTSTRPSPSTTRRSRRRRADPGTTRSTDSPRNTANYVPTEEIFLPDPFATRAARPAVTSRFFDFNPRFDERDFATDLRAAFAARGCANCGMLIDTSRNGWGGPARPTAVRAPPST